MGMAAGQRMAASLGPTPAADAGAAGRRALRPAAAGSAAAARAGSVVPRGRRPAASARSTAAGLAAQVSAGTLTPATLVWKHGHGAVDRRRPGPRTRTDPGEHSAAAAAAAARPSAGLSPVRTAP